MSALTESPANFSNVPILDYSLLSDPASRPKFIVQLRHALINVGFLYLANSPVSDSDINDLITYIPKLFALPQEEKDKIRMVNSQHFLGYSRLGAELTRGRVDQREQFDFATEHICRWTEGKPDYLRLWGPSQWPDQHIIPGFRATMESYLTQVQALSYEFSSLLGEALGLSAGALAHFYDTDDKMQHRAKIVQYPVVDEASSSDQGVGPHYDAGFLTFVASPLLFHPADIVKLISCLFSQLLQASPHRGLQVQNLSGQWIDVPPIPGTFVVNIGKALEFATQGLARATSHRVISPRRESGPTTPRYSVPFFQNISLDIRLADCVLEFPSEILKLRDERGKVAATDSVNFSEFDREPSGKVNLIGRIKSHPHVAQQHYPTLFKQFFPHGLPDAGSVSAY